jgi:type III secretion protein S
MDNSDLTRSLIEIYWDSAIFIAVPMVIGTVVAFVIAVFQAMTQISEQTLPQTAKIGAIGVVLLLFGSALAQPLYQTSERLFNDFAKPGGP